MKRLTVLGVSCPACGAPKGKRCTDHQFRAIKAHEGRYQKAARERGEASQ